jgi:uncharacterized delta-60 repeat protein
MKHFKFSILLLTAICSLLPTLLYSQVDTAWVRRWSSASYYSDYVYGLTVDNSGNVYVTGSSAYLDPPSDIITIKYGPNGDSIWASIYSRTNSQLARSVAVGNSGCVYVTGYTMESGTGDYITIKYRPNGDTAWVRRYNGTAGTRYDVSRKLVLDNAENVYISGYSQETNYQYTYATIKYDSAGTLLWARRDSFGGAYVSHPNDLALDNSGNPYIVTKTKHPTQRDNWLVIKYKSDTPDTYWTRTYNGPSDSTDDARGIAFDNLNNVYVTGMSYDATTKYDIVTIKYNSSGDTQWVRRWSNPDTNASDAGYWIRADGSGNVYVYGTTYSKAPAGQDLVVLKYNSSGVFQWATRYDGPATGYDNVIDKDAQNGMGLDLLGNIYIAGYCRQPSLPTKYDFVTIKFNPSGDTLWTQRYNYADSTDYNPSMFVDNSGNVYVTGRSAATGTYYDIATIKYTQAGGVTRDVGVTKIDLPVMPAMIDSGTVITPACSVYNYGNTVETYPVRMKIGNFYNQDTTVFNHSPGSYQYIQFPDWTVLERGNLVVTCSTELSIDMIHSNDRKIDSVFVRVLDVGVSKIIAPFGALDSGTVTTPACSVYNYGNTAEDYLVRMKIGSLYDEDTLITSHTPGSPAYIRFPAWTATQIGVNPVACSTALTGDANNLNDILTDSVIVQRVVVQPSGWIKMANIPLQPSGKKPKYGTCMAGLAATAKIYFLKASNTQDFYIYTPDADTGTWTNNPADTIPLGIKTEGDGKKPKRGASMTAFDSAVYVLRGNNTVGFWKYIAVGDSRIDPLVRPDSGGNLGWKKLQNITLGAKAPKDGSGLASVKKGSVNYVFAMKGSKTNEFYLYDIMNNTWLPRLAAPQPGASGKIGYKSGSCLTYDGDSLVYVLKGNYGDFFKYNLVADTWIELRRYDYKVFLNRDSKKKRPKDGAGLVYSRNNVYMLKAGNTREFWKYDVAADTWIQMDSLWDIPLGGGKRVKSGACLTILDTSTTKGRGEGEIYAGKGSNTDEFYMHTPPEGPIVTLNPNPSTSGTAGTNFAAPEFKLLVVPNPTINLTAVRYNLPKAGPVSIKLYNAYGALVKSYVNSIPSKNGTLMIDAKTLPTGVYILRFNAGDIRVNRKLVLQK